MLPRLGPKKMRKRDMKWKLADLDLTNRWSAQLKSISVPYIRAFWRGKRNGYYLCLRFIGHFPGEPGLAGVYWSQGWWRWWWQLDYWSYKSCKAPVKSSPPTNQQPVFYRPDALPVTQPTVSKHWREENKTVTIMPKSCSMGLCLNSSANSQVHILYIPGWTETKHRTII